MPKVHVTIGLVGTLYIVATPIGNLKDITQRGLETLSTVDSIACEDTRKTGNLLKILSIPALPAGRLSNISIKKPVLLSYNEYNEAQRIPQILNLLKNGQNVALVSDAGTPTISDPGFKLVRECIQNGIRVESVPGPSALISALVSSGLPTDKFLFLGFLPQKPGKRRKLLDELFRSFERSKVVHFTTIFFEAPHKLVRTLGELQEVLGDIEIVLGRELTKIHEEVRREKISDALKHYSKIEPKGEFVILFHLAENNSKTR